MNPLIRFKTETLPLLISLVLGSFAVAPTAQAVSPAPDGGYDGANTAEGDFALASLVVPTEFTSIGNTALGYRALFNTTTGSSNTATGANALDQNTEGGLNTAIGFWALYHNTTGSSNTATGEFALSSNTAGDSNMANGAAALFFNTSGDDNTAVGANALHTNTSGQNNIALGFRAGFNLTTGNNNIDIGNEGIAGESNTIRIGTQGTQTATFIAGINGAAIGGGGAVRVNANGQLGTAPSSARFKQNIKPMDKASEAIHALKPVTFRYKPELDPDGAPQFGLVAEDVEKVNPDLVARGADGRVYTVRYEAVNAMLLNEFLKEHCKVQDLEATIAKQEALNALQQKQIEALTAGLQRVSAQIEASKSAPQVVNNP
jgi:hypothetical protein